MGTYVLLHLAMYISLEDLTLHCLQTSGYQTQSIEIGTSKYYEKMYIWAVMVIMSGHIAAVAAAYPFYVTGGQAYLMHATVGQQVNRRQFSL